jgi:hypothetical protein
MLLCITPRSPTDLTKTASLDGGQTSESEFALVPTLPIGADVPRCVVAVTRAHIGRGSAI